MNDVDPQRELEVLRHEFRTVFDAVPSRIWYKDDNNRILRLNKAAAESMGMSVEEVEGQNIYDLFGESAKAYHEADLQVINSGEPILGLVEPYTPIDGHAGWVKTDKIPVTDPSSQEKRILVVSEDVPKLEESSALLKNINANLDDFYAMVSHDLQGPLRHISVFADILKGEHGEKLDEDALSYIDEIQAGTRKMRRMIKSFLAFIRSSPGGYDLHLVDLVPVLQNVIETLSTDIEKYGVKINLPHGPIHIRGVSALLCQVFRNLFETALKYRHQDRPLEIDVSAKLDGEQWLISVTDNGVGVGQDQIRYIFDVFGHAKNNSQSGGYGLNLVTCHRIIMMHGGSIQVDPNHERGAKFDIRLNIARA